MVTPQQFFASRFIRFSYWKMDRKRDAGQTTPSDIIRYDDIQYGNDRRFIKWQLLDVYRPKAAVNPDNTLKKLPLIISVHGGSFIYGDKTKYQFYCMRLAQRGFAVINFSYRLAPEVPYFSSIRDVETVFQWAAVNSEQYGFDTENLFTVADSAGGHLLATYLNAITDKTFGDTLGFIKDKGVKVKAAALNCGKYQLEENDGKIKLLRKSLMPGASEKDAKAFLNVYSHITKAFPPVFVMTCKGDFLKEDSEKIKVKFDEIGVKNEFHCYGTEEKPLWHVFHCDPKLEEAVTCNDEECNFFRSFIK